MPSTDTNLADRSGQLVDLHTARDPRIVLFYFFIAVLLALLIGGLAYQQLVKVDAYADAARQQTQRRVFYPGPRGVIEDREGRLLVGNRAQFSVRLMLDQLRPELRREQIRIRNNYRATGDKDVPSRDQLSHLARVSVVQRYLNQVNALIGRNEQVDGRRLGRHFVRELLLPYTLIDDLSAAEYGRLWEGLPVNSPAQVYTMSAREYPYGSAAAHTLGYVGESDDVTPDDFPGEDLKTFRMKGTTGREGIEKRFEETLRGEAGGAIYRVDPAGNRISKPIEQVLPRQGKNLRLSLDIDLQIAAEVKLAETEMAGAAVVLDVLTGEVLVLASKPDYDLAKFSPRISAATWADAEERGAFFKRAIQGAYPPGSAFKILTTIAALRSGVITTGTTVNCPGFFVMGRKFACHDHAVHGEIGLRVAIEKSCNVYFYKSGFDMGPDTIAAEARRFHLDRPTGIELPDETRRMIIPSPEWKRERHKQGWAGGDTVQMAIGQGFVLVTPLQMACFAASVARNEVWTQPTLLHDPERPRQRTEPIGLKPEQRAALIQAMEDVTLTGTAKILTNGRLLPQIPGLRIAGKTGTAQKDAEGGKKINFAWFIGFAPAENPRIAMAIAIEGDTPGEETGGGRYAAPVAHAILKTWAEKQSRAAQGLVRFKSE
ncbi:MAG: penicillin-binding transpeptidase domain-containing protein [Opitutaceae bacterium]|nr:penicillin-binding transpeptidase domain-containing protein [Opitutaceae bacterium]